MIPSDDGENLHYLHLLYANRSWMLRKSRSNINQKPSSCYSTSLNVCC